MNVCISCDQPTSNQRAKIGDTEGPICEDCAYWSDGNIVTDATDENGSDAPA